MAKTSVVAKLKALQKKWKAAAPRTGGGLPDGDYEGVIKSGVIKACQNGELQAAWEIEVTGPDGFEGRKQNKFAYLGGENSLDWFKGDLATLGIDLPDSMEDIPSVMGETEGLAVAFRIRSKQENTNVYFLGLLEGEEVGDDGSKDTEDEGGEDELTADDVTALGEADDEEGLQTIIDDYELDIDQDDYAEYTEVAELIIEELEL
jgi:hypothetical protein